MKSCFIDPNISRSRNSLRKVEILDEREKDFGTESHSETALDLNHFVSLIILVISLFQDPFSYGRFTGATVYVPGPVWIEGIKNISNAISYKKKTPVSGYDSMNFPLGLK